MGTAMVLGVLLLVERSESIRGDVELVLSDLENCSVPVTALGTGVLRQILDMYGHATEEETDSVVAQVSSLCGGKDSVRNWFQRRCSFFYNPFNVDDFLDLENLQLPLWQN